MRRALIHHTHHRTCQSKKKNNWVVPKYPQICDRKLRKESLLSRKYPVWDVARPTPQVLMEQARRDLMDADEKLALKREEESRNRALMNTKWDELRNKEMLLKESFISFNKVCLLTFMFYNFKARKRSAIATSGYPYIW